MDTHSLFEAYKKAQGTGKPVARYRKAILGKVGVTIIDPIEGKPTDIIIEGNPADPEKQNDVIITFWTDFEHDFFRRTNKILLSRGYLAICSDDVDEATISVNEVSDEDLREALNKPYFAIKALLDRFTSPAPVLRMLRMAEEMNKPVGTIEKIKERVSELQREE